MRVAKDTRDNSESEPLVICISPRARSSPPILTRGFLLLSRFAIGHHLLLLHVKELLNVLNQVKFNYKSKGFVGSVEVKTQEEVTDKESTPNNTHPQTLTNAHQICAQFNILNI